MHLLIKPALAAALLAALALPAAAEDAKTVTLSLKGTTFTPAELHVPAGQPFVISFTNENDKAAELESSELGVEKVAKPGTTIVVRVKALDKGSYGFVDEFQEDDAKGMIVAE